MKATLYGTYGYLGAGKTYFSRRLSEKEHFVHLSGDMIRSTLMQHPAYTAEEHARVFGLMDVLTADILSKGVSVIYDVCLTKQEHRERLQKIAADAGADFKLIWLTIDENLAVDRVNDPALSSTPERQFISYVSEPLTVFDQIKNEMDDPEVGEIVIKIDGTKGFAQQYADFKEQNVI